MTNPTNIIDAIKIRRCLDHEEIENILHRDYFDDPVPYLSERALRTFARKWIARRSQVYLMTAYVDGAYAGFVFGHTLGPRFWRLFASKHPSVLPALVWARLKMKFAPKLERQVTQLQANGSNRSDLESEIAALKIPVRAQPFAWAAEGSGAGIIPLLFVQSDHRGKGVALHLLDGICREMFRSGANCVEAHVDLNNLSSARAFLKAGFEVHRMATNDFWARKVNANEPLKESQC